MKLSEMSDGELGNFVGMIDNDESCRFPERTEKLFKLIDKEYKRRNRNEKIQSK